MIFAPSPEQLLWASIHFIFLPLAWIVGLFLSRRRPLRLVAWTGLTIAIYGALSFAARIGTYQLTLQVLDPGRRACPNSPVSYFSRGQGNGIGQFSPDLNGDVTTDQSGQIVLHPNREHALYFTIRDPRFQDGSFQITACFGNEFQINAGDELTFVQPARPPHPGAWDFGYQSQQKLIVALKPK